MGCSLAVKRNEVRIHITSWMNLENMSSEKSWSHKTTYDRIHLYETPRIGKSRDSKYIHGCLGLGDRSIKE